MKTMIEEAVALSKSMHQEPTELERLLAALAKMGEPTKVVFVQTYLTNDTRNPWAGKNGGQLERHPQ